MYRNWDLLSQNKPSGNPVAAPIFKHVSIDSSRSSGRACMHVENWGGIYESRCAPKGKFRVKRKKDAKFYLKISTKRTKGELNFRENCQKRTIFYLTILEYSI
jgi:hypothetical protein